MKRLVIAIDGPSGAGKTTVSRMLADRLGYRYIDTGALYRGVAFEIGSKGISHNDDKSIEKLCASMSIYFKQSENGSRLIVNDLDITRQIRTPEISMFASEVSARPVVRNYLLHLQRNMGRKKGVVFEGRDMGTVVFPDADIKFYLDASSKTRARRRYKEFLSKTSQSFEDVEKDINKRDKNDSSRSLAPLKSAKDAIIIDSTDISAEDVVALMLSHIKNPL